MKRVVIYARVSTEHEAQISALENQVQYYDEILKRHPDWVLVERYIDEGITGTSINKRKSFLRMMEDAKHGRFELIVTREVSRFARNIVDTLQQTRLLKSYGVEVWFTEDNIWTMNDEDGELRLSIMATLAQNESKKVSQRVKAGQMISFKNGVLYGNGNILGYDRVGDKMVVNRGQAETVRRIFDLYLSGKGIRAIKDILEQEKRLTAAGLVRWHSSTISHLLRNPFYCGRIIYRKQYVPDYLTQKKINNKGEVEQIFIMGSHEPLISEEDFDKVQELLKERSKEMDERRRVGVGYAKSIWVRKTKCKCGHSMNRRCCYTSKAGEKSFFFQCYGQLHHGTPKTRAKKGLSTEGICDNNTFPEWKLEVCADFLFRNLIANKQAIFDRAMAMVDDMTNIQGGGIDRREQIEKNMCDIDRLKTKIAVLVDMCAEGDIPKEIYREKKETLESKIKDIEKRNEDIRALILDEEKNTLVEERIKTLEAFAKMKAFDENGRIPSTLIEYYVDTIVYYKGMFHWVLNPIEGSAMKEIDFDMSEVRKHRPRNKILYDVPSHTGSYQLKTVIDNALFLGIFEISKSYMVESLKLYYEDFNFKFPESMEIKVYLN